MRSSSTSLIYTNIGQILNLFNHLEDELKQVIAFLIEIPEKKKADIILGQLSFKQLTDIFSSLVLLEFDSHKSVLVQLKKISKQLSHCAKERNIFVHSVWSKQFPLNGNSKLVRTRHERLGPNKPIARNTLDVPMDQFSEWHDSLYRTLVSIIEFSTDLSDIREATKLGAT